MDKFFGDHPSIEHVAAAAETSVSSVIRDVRRGLLRRFKGDDGRVTFDPQQATDYVAKRRAINAARKALTAA